jgi:hypothetical protein
VVSLVAARNRPPARAIAAQKKVAGLEELSCPRTARTHAELASVTATQLRPMRGGIVDMGRPKGSIRKPRLIPAEWLSVYTHYVKRGLEMRGVPERNQPKNDDLITELIGRLSDWLDWKRVDEFIESEARKRGTWAWHEPKGKHKRAS